MCFSKVWKWWGRERGREGGKKKRQAVLFVEFFSVAKPKCWPCVCSSELALHTHTQNLGFPL